MNVLAIRLARFGDVVLLLPALGRLKAVLPDSRLTLLTGGPCGPLAEMCPAIDHVISVDRVSMRDGSRLRAIQDIGRLLRNVRSRGFDLTIDFHGLRETSLLAWLSGSGQRLGLKRFDQSYLGFCFNLEPVAEDKTIHVANMFMRIAERGSGGSGLGGEPLAPPLVVPESARAWTASVLPAGPRVVLYVDAPVPERIWPPERFAAVGDYAAGHWNSGVVVLSGPSGGRLVQKILGVARYGAEFHAFSNLTIPQLAAVVESGTLLISNDTGPMHLGPAFGVPTLGLFSVGVPEHFRPSGVGDQFVQGNPIEKIEVEEVIGRIDRMWATPARDTHRDA